MARMDDTTDRRVSCAALEVYLLALEQHGASSEAFFAGLPFDEAYIRQPRNRISWADYCILTDRLTVIVGGPDGLKAIGRTLTRSSHFKTVERILRLVAGPRQLYNAVSYWAQPMMWPMLRSTVTVTGPRTLRIYSKLSPDYRPCPGFFYIAAGGMELLPQALGLPMATAHIETDGIEAVFDITHPPSMTIWARLYRAITAPWSAQALLTEQREQIDELNERLRELDEARHRAQAAESIRRDLLVNISHELRTPITAILGASEALHASALAPPQRTEVDRIRGQSAALLRLVEDTLDLSRTVAGRLDIDRAPTDIRAVAASVFSDAAERAEAKGLSAVLQVAEAVPELVHLDQRRLRQVLCHLLDNAVNFTATGEIALRLGGAWEGERFVLQVAVRDTGAGIPAEWLADIFQPFTQQDRSLTRRVEGAGLGLAVSRGIVEMMGGTLAVTSTPGAGSCFTVRLPVEASAEAAADTAEPPSPPAAPVAQLQRALRVLLVEDNTINQVMISRQLAALGAEVDVAEDGLRGVERFTAGCYDLILMDIQMPRLDGFGATDRIRALPGGAATPILAVTANAHPGYDEVCRSRGMDAFLAKPLQLDQLASAIAALCDRPDAAAAPH